MKPSMVIPPALATISGLITTTSARYIPNTSSIASVLATLSLPIDNHLSNPTSSSSIAAPSDSSLSTPAESSHPTKTLSPGQIPNDIDPKNPHSKRGREPTATLFAYTMTTVTETHVSRTYWPYMDSYFSSLNQHPTNPPLTLTPDPKKTDVAYEWFTFTTTETFRTWAPPGWAPGEIPDPDEMKQFATIVNPNVDH